MRTISSAGQTTLATNLGTEPINVIEIQWVPNGPINSYADRDISGTVQGRILELGALDNTVKASEGGENQAIAVTLDDTDGSIKNILDHNDIHKRPCWVYQYFDGLALSDKFLLFKGHINSPIEWNEGERTVKFNIISKIEDAEIGFSIEEGNFPNPPYELIGRPWPLCFGTVVNVPALRLKNLLSGTLASGVGISDFTLPLRIELSQQLCCPTQFMGYQVFQDPVNLSLTFLESFGADPGCVANNCAQTANLKLQLQQQKRYEFGSLTVFGGRYFPQHRGLTLEINGAIFTGSFNGDTFSISSRRHPAFFGLRGNPNYGGPAFSINDGIDAYLSYVGMSGFLSADGVEDLIALKQRFVVGTGCPGSGAFGQSLDAHVQGLDLCGQKQRLLDNAPVADFFWAPAGATVSLAGPEEVIYISNILPSTVLSVKAYREFDSGRVLVTVPSQYYQVRHTNYGAYICTEIVFTIPLSRRGVGWSDDIYVTQTSSVGPNTCDILKWLIQKYTPYGVDNASFNHVAAMLDKYPMHFPILDRKNILTALEEISMQARCAVYLRNDVFYIKYLSEEPGAFATITENEIEAKSLEFTHTETEDLVTKFVADWRYDYALSDPNKIIMRHNVAQYGMHQQTYDFYCYNIVELVQKSASFWLIRKANTWRRIKCKVPLKFLNLETFDCVNVTLPDFSPNTIKCIVEKTEYDSASNRIDLELWTPVQSGSQVTYDFAFPSQVDPTLLFPKIIEQKAGRAGGGFTPGFFTGAPPGHQLDAGNSGLFQGASLEYGCIGGITPFDSDAACRPDFGEQTPSDKNDTKPGVNATNDPGSVYSGQSPDNLANLGLNNKLAELQSQIDALKAAVQKAQATANAANEAAGGAGSSSGSGNGTDKNGKPKPKLSNLPKPGDKKKQAEKNGEPAPCLSCVSVGWFALKKIKILNREICVPAQPGVSHVETACFYDDGGASRFANVMQQRLDQAKAEAQDGSDDPTCNPPFALQVILSGCTAKDGQNPDEIAEYSHNINGSPAPPDEGAAMDNSWDPVVDD